MNKVVNKALELTAPMAHPEYSTGHTAPTPEPGAMMHDPDMMFPDIHTHGRQYYGTGQDYDNESLDKISRARHNPSAPVVIYRAIPKGLKGESINPGDWVTTSESYAHEHGEGALNGKYKVVRKRVRADELATDGNSIHEWGYWPNGNKPMIKGLHESREQYDERRKQAAIEYKKLMGYKRGGLAKALNLTAGR